MARTSPSSRLPLRLSQRQTRLAVTLPAPLSQGQQIRLCLRFVTRVPEKFGPFGAYKGGLTLAGGWYPLPVPLRAGRTDFAAPLPLRQHRARLHLPAGYQLLLGRRFYANTPKPLLFQGRVRALPLRLERRFRLLQQQVGTIRLLYYTYRNPPRPEPPSSPEHPADLPQDPPDLCAEDPASRVLRALARALKLLQQDGIRPLSSPVVAVETPLRTGLTFTADRALWISDWALKLFPLRRIFRFQEYRLLRGLADSLLREGLTLPSTWQPPPSPRQLRPSPSRRRSPPSRRRDSNPSQHRSPPSRRDSNPSQHRSPPSRRHSNPSRRVTVRLARRNAPVWLSELLASYLEEKLRRRQGAGRDSAFRLVGWASWHPYVDLFLYAPRGPFVRLYFDRPDDEDPYRDGPFTVYHGRASGKRIFEKLKDLLGWRRLQSLLGAALRQRHSKKALQQQLPQRCPRPPLHNQQQSQQQSPSLRRPSLRRPPLRRPPLRRPPLRRPPLRPPPAPDHPHRPSSQRLSKSSSRRLFQNTSRYFSKSSSRRLSKSNSQHFSKSNSQRLFHNKDCLQQKRLFWRRLLAPDPHVNYRLVGLHSQRTAQGYLHRIVIGRQGPPTGLPVTVLVQTGPQRHRLRWLDRGQKPASARSSPPKASASPVSAPSSLPKASTSSASASSSSPNSRTSPVSTRTSPPKASASPALARKTFTLRSPYPLSRVRIDPKRRLVEKRSAQGNHPLFDNVAPHPWKFVLTGFLLQLLASEAFVTGQISAGLERQYDLKNYLGFSGFWGRSSWGVGGSYYRFLGRSVAANRLPHALGASLSVSRLRADFGNAGSEPIHLGLGLSYYFDTRRTYSYPQRGTACGASLAYGLVLPAQGDPLHFVRANARFLQIVPLADTHQLALRLNLGFLLGHAPKQSLWPLGGRYGVRGYQTGEWLDKFRLLASIEYRHLFTRDLDINLLHLWRWRGLQGALFLEGAYLGPALDLSQLPRYHAAVGYGLRFHFDWIHILPSVLSVDVAVPLGPRGQGIPPFLPSVYVYLKQSFSSF